MNKAEWREALLETINKAYEVAIKVGDHVGDSEIIATEYKAMLDKLDYIMAETTEPDITKDLKLIRTFISGMAGGFGSMSHTNVETYANDIADYLSNIGIEDMYENN